MLLVFHAFWDKLVLDETCTKRLMLHNASGGGVKLHFSALNSCLMLLTISFYCKLFSTPKKHASLVRKIWPR